MGSIGGKVGGPLGNSGERVEGLGLIGVLERVNPPQERWGGGVLERGDAGEMSEVRP